MKKFNLSEFTKGWFIGDFTPTLLNTLDFEISIKRYKAGDIESRHHHKIATEYTVIVDGEVTMNGSVFKTNDIVIINPNESTDFVCLTDVTTVVVKTPSIKDDKFNG
jgi:mannose-6-phosphate isomerase-like protein (cupin superfamily)